MKNRVSNYLNRFGGYFFTLLRNSYRYSLHGVDIVTDLLKRKKHVIFTFWHRELLGILSFCSGVPNIKRLQVFSAEDQMALSELFKLDFTSFSAVVVSASRDGDIVSQFLTKSGFPTIRGSSGSRGLRAALGIVRYFKSRTDNPAFVIMIADGSRGPAGEVQKGVAFTARLTRSVILPCSSVAHPHICFPSWDKMIVPLPFSHVSIVAGLPIDPDEYEEGELITKIKNSLNNCHQRALNLLLKA